MYMSTHSITGPWIFKVHHVGSRGSVEKKTILICIYYNYSLGVQTGIMKVVDISTLGFWSGNEH